jgi:hypothetical protein
MAHSGITPMYPQAQMPGWVGWMLVIRTPHSCARNKEGAMFHIAQINIGRIKAPLDDRIMARFVARLDEIMSIHRSITGEGGEFCSAIIVR